MQPDNVISSQTLTYILMAVGSPIVKLLGNPDFTVILYNSESLIHWIIIVCLMLHKKPPASSAAA